MTQDDALKQLSHMARERARPPDDPHAAKWAMAYWIAEQIADRSLDPAVGTHLIWADIASDLGYPEDLEPLVHCAHNLDGWEESWDVSVEELNREAIEAAKKLLSKRTGEELEGQPSASRTGVVRHHPASVTQRTSATEVEPEPVLVNKAIAHVTRRSMGRLLDLGVDSITTNRVDVLHALRNGSGIGGVGNR